MKTKSTTAPARTKIPGRGRELCELGRRAGPHGKRRKDRTNTRRGAINFEYRAG